MNTELKKLLNANANLNVIVIGEAILNCYLEGFSDRLGDDASVPAITVTNRKVFLSGAANRAVELHNCGSRVTFLSVVGSDSEGKLLRQALLERGVSTKHVLVHSSRQTLSSHRLMAGTQMLVRFNQGSTDPIDTGTEEAVMAELDRCFPACDALIVCDRGAGILTERLRLAIANLQHSSPHVLVVEEREKWGAEIPFSPPQPLTSAEKYVSDPNLLVDRIVSYRTAGCRIVFTNGCFDILHPGHVSYLERAKALGDILIIGVNSDDSIRRLKGPSRPINPLEDRIQVLAALSCVNYLVSFDEDTLAT